MHLDWKHLICVVGCGEVKMGRDVKAAGDDHDDTGWQEAV
jgi:hypothetical protein